MIEVLNIMIAIFMIVVKFLVGMWFMFLAFTSHRAAVRGNDIEYNWFWLYLGIAMIIFSI